MKFLEFISNNFNKSLSTWEICQIKSKSLFPFYDILVKSNCFYKFDTYDVVLSCFFVLKAFTIKIKLSFALRLLNPISINGFLDTYYKLTYRDNNLLKNLMS